MFTLHIEPLVLSHISHGGIKHMDDWWCRLDVYIYDYLVKRNLQASAKAFLNEGKVSSDPVGTIFNFGRLCSFATFVKHLLF